MAAQVYLRPNFKIQFASKIAYMESNYDIIG